MRTILLAAFALSLAACAGPTASGPGATAQAGSCSPATADRGAVVYSQPDESSHRIATITERTQVCADSEKVGFGFRRIKLSNGKQGYVADSQLM